MFRKLVALMIVLTFGISISATPADRGQRKTDSGNKSEAEAPAESDLSTQQSQTQQTEIQQAIQDATQEVAAYNAMGWGIGSASASVCVPVVGGIVVVGMARQTPILPIEGILGKTPTYIEQYTRTYKKEIKRKRSKYAIVGTCVGSGVLSLLLIATANEDPFEGCSPNCLFSDSDGDACLTGLDSCLTDMGSCTTDTGSCTGF